MVVTLARRSLQRGCGTAFPHRAPRACPSLSLLKYSEKFVRRRKLGSSCIVNRKNVREDGSSKAATRNPTKDLACRNREQQNNLDWNWGHRNLTACEARQSLGFSIGFRFDDTSLAVLHERPKFSSIMPQRRCFCLNSPETPGLSSESAKRHPP